MPDELDPKQIWQNQPTEPIKMSLEEIRRKAQQLHAKSRIAALSSIAIGLAVAVFFARTSINSQDTPLRVGWAMLSIWGIYAAWQAYRWIWPGRLAVDATWNTSLQFYRTELEKKRDYERHIWQRSGLLVAFAGVAVILAPALRAALQNPRLLVNMAPFFILLVTWFAIFVPMRKRNREKLQREIDELNSIEKENRP